MKYRGSVIGGRPAGLVTNCVRLLLVNGLVACAGGDATFAPTTDPHALLRSVRLTQHAYNLATMAPYDTVRLHATATLADGALSRATIRYVSNDSNVQVDSSGFLRVVKPPTHSIAGGGMVNNLATVYASATVGGQTRRDSAIISVITDPPVVPARLVISTIRADYVGGSWLDTLTLRWPKLVLDGTGSYVAQDTDGNPLNTILGAVESDDSTVAAIIHASRIPFGYGFYLTPHKPGHTWIHISSYAYGVTLRDSIPIIVGEPRTYGIQASLVQHVNDTTVTTTLHFFPDSLDVPAGSDVIWRAPRNCIYDDPTLSNPPSPDLWGQPAHVNPSCQGTPIDVTFDQPQYALASRIPAAYGETIDIYLSNFDPVDGGLKIRYGYNNHGGVGNISTFQSLYVDTRTSQCSVILPVNCIVDAAEARLFDRPGRYPYHVEHGPVGIKGATGVLIVH